MRGTAKYSAGEEGSSLSQYAATEPNLTDMSEKVGHHDALYLFACYLEWRSRRSLAAYQELLAALDDPNCEIRSVAEVLLRRNALRPQPNETSVEAW